MLVLRRPRAPCGGERPPKHGRRRGRRCLMRLQMTGPRFGGLSGKRQSCVGEGSLELRTHRMVRSEALAQAARTAAEGGGGRGAGSPDAEAAGEDLRPQAGREQLAHVRRLQEVGHRLDLQPHPAPTHPRP